MPALNREQNDLGVKPIPPLSPVDIRVPMAEEFALDAEIQMSLYAAGRSSVWLEPPSARIEGVQVRLTGKAQLSIVPQAIDLNLLLAIVPLRNTIDLVDRLDHYYLVGFSCEVGASQDASLGQVNFSYQTVNTVQGVQKENSRRIRSFWVVLASPREVITSDILALLTDGNLLVSNTSDAGFALGIFQLYAKDGHLQSGKTYGVYTDSIVLLPIAGLRRRQNRMDGGYTYGSGGELVSEIQPVFTPLPEQISKSDFRTEFLAKRVVDICSGKTSRLKSEQISIQNLSVNAGVVALNRLGESIVSPNGSLAVANDQRISFSNQQVLEKTGAYAVVVGNNGGAPLISIGLNTSAPVGSFFSREAADHLIYKADGTEQSNLGSFSNLGGVGSLQWLGTGNSTLTPGETAYIVPCIVYPAGSGFSIPFDRITSVWVNGTALNPSNILVGWKDDLDGYLDPVGGDQFMVVTGSERSAIHYVYKKISITVGLNGVAVLPPGESGCFAFIEGVDGRLNRPVVDSVPPGVRSALVYHAPGSFSSWQFELKHSSYQGLGSSWRSFCDGATISSEAMTFAHTQGGGGSVFQGDRQTQYVPISAHLPSVNWDIKSYSLDGPIYLAGEAYQGPKTFARIPPLAGQNAVLPLPGNILDTETRSVDSDRTVDFSLNSGLSSVGFFAPKMFAGIAYQFVAAFAITKDGITKMVVATKNVQGGETVLLDPEEGTAIDVFELI